MELKEQVIQKFPQRCPYCDRPISYDQFDLKTGENEIQCPSCKKIYIKVVSDISPPPSPSSSRRLCRNGRIGKDRRLPKL